MPNQPPNRLRTPNPNWRHRPRNRRLRLRRMRPIRGIAQRRLHLQINGAVVAEAAVVADAAAKDLVPQRLLRLL